MWCVCSSVAVVCASAKNVQKSEVKRKMTQRGRGVRGGEGGREGGGCCGGGGGGGGTHRSRFVYRSV